MKKNILKVALVAIFAFFAGYGVYTSQKSVDLSALALDNAEALAYGEIGIGTICVTSCTNCWCYYPPCCGLSNNDYWADGEPYNN